MKLEICYNILYVERHNRRLRDPWSLRQTGVYHQFCNDMTYSRWILLNLGDSFTWIPKEFLEDRSDTCPLNLHAQLLATSGSHWTEYIEYLELELQKHVSRSNDLQSLQ